MATRKAVGGCGKDKYLAEVVMYGGDDILLGLCRQDLPEGKVAHVLGQGTPVSPHNVQPLLLLNLCTTMHHILFHCIILCCITPPEHRERSKHVVCLLGRWSFYSSVDAMTHSAPAFDALSSCSDTCFLCRQLIFSAHHGLDSALCTMCKTASLARDHIMHASSQSVKPFHQDQI